MNWLLISAVGMFVCMVLEPGEFTKMGLASAIGFYIFGLMFLYQLFLFIVPLVK